MLVVVSGSAVERPSDVATISALRPTESGGLRDHFHRRCEMFRVTAVLLVSAAFMMGGMVTGCKKGAKGSDCAKLEKKNGIA